MAEETINTAENVNAPMPDVNDLMAESDLLNPARIEQPLAPKANWPDTFVNTTNYIKDNTAGVSPGYPPSQVSADRRSGATEGGLQAIIDKGMSEINSISDVSNYAQPYAYDASPKGTFRERYKAYGQDTFNEIGFHPLIDNETFFNQNTTFGDDLQRWGSHSLWPMLSKGFTDPIKSYKSVIDGDGFFDADPQSARDYEYYNAIGASTKGGLGGFTVNLFNSAAYSMGILTEGAVEGFLIGGLFGGGNVATGAAEGAGTFLSKLGSLPKSLVQTGQAVGKLFSGVKNYSKLAEAKSLFASASKNFGNFINPAHNTLQAYNQLKNTDNITNLARSATTAGALWHDMMVMNLALSEGKLEGGFTRTQTYDRLYNKHVEEHNGTPPTLEEQESMMRQASKGSFENTLSNTALVYYSNKLVFPSITNASFLKGIPRFGFGKVVTNVGKDFQVVFNPGKSALEGTFAKQRINLANAIKSLAKPATYGKVGLNYFKANLVEGGQELAQDVLQEATQNYYVNTYKNTEGRNFRYSSGLLGEAIGKQWSAQGLETFLSGFLMGSILQAPGFVKKYATVGYNDYLKKDSSYKTYLDQREEMADDVVNNMNTMYKNGKYFFDSRINNYVTQSLVAKEIANPGDLTTKEIKDNEFTAFHSAVLSSLQNGTFDMFLNHYEGYKQASPKDIEEAWELQPGQGAKALERFDKSIESAKVISKRWIAAKDKMQFMANLDDFEKDTEEYRIAEVYNKAYNQALYNYVFVHQAFDDNINREKKLFETLSSLSVIKNSNFSDFAGFTDPNRLQREIEMMNTEIESLESFGSAESIEEATKKREKVELYSRFQEKQEKLVELFIYKKVFEQIKDGIKKDNPQISDTDASLQTINTLIEQYDKGESNEFLDYKEAFNDLLIGLADTTDKKRQLEQEIQNMGGIDVLFNDLLETHILRNETAKLNQYVNLLANPRDFYEHVMGNFKFMKDLYHNREEIVKEIVNQEISAIEKNTLLNTLADQGIFVDLEQFSKWVENSNMLPEYFIDVTNNRMINKGSIIYEDYIELFQKMADLDLKKPAGEPLSQKQLLDKRIEVLEEERKQFLEKERIKYEDKFKQANGLTIDEYLQQEATRIAENELTPEERASLEKEKELVLKIIDKLQSENYVEVQSAAEILATEILQPKGIDAAQILAEQTNIYQNDEAKRKLIGSLFGKYDVSDIEDEQEAQTTQVDTALKSEIFKEVAASRLSEIDSELAKQDTTPTIDIEKTKEYLVYQEATDAINERYDNLIAETKDEFKRKGIDENTPDEYTTKTEFEDFDSEFQEKITELFNAYLVDVLQEDINIKTKNPLEYERLRSNWLERQSGLINTFNTEAKQKSLDKAERLANAPQLKFIDIEINAQTTTYTISNIISRFQSFLDAGEYPNPKNNKEMISASKLDLANLKEDIEALTGYLSARVEASEPRNIAEQTIQIIEENIIAKQDELVDIVNEDGIVIGRTFKDRGPNDPIPSRTTEVATEVEASLKNKDPFIIQPLKDVVDEDGVVTLSPIENLYNQFFNDPDIVPADRVRLFMEAFKAKAYSGWKTFKSEKKLKDLEDFLNTKPNYEKLKKFIADLAFRESSGAGDIVDSLIRVFLTPNAGTKSKFSEFEYDSVVDIKGKSVKISDVMSRKVFDKLFAQVSTTNPGGYITKFRLGIIDGTYRILSENVKVFDKALRNENGVTGELDLLLVRADGTIAIVDIKTSKATKWKSFGDNTDYDTSTYFRAQQSIYGYTVYNMTGILPELKLMPFEIDVTIDGYINDITTAPIVKNGEDTVDLEYLSEIENFGIIKIKPDIKTPIKKTEDNQSIIDTGIAQSDPIKNKLEDNLDKPIIFNGQTGKLVKMQDGNFGVQVTINADITTLQLTLDTLNANLLIETNEENIAELKESINRLSNAINSAEGFTEIYPLQKNSKGVSNGSLTVNEVGVQLIIPIESVGQVSTIKSKVVNASFSNKEESIASINGVRYEVLRDASGNITVLSYMSNAEQIKDIDNQINSLAQKVSNLRKSLNNREEDNNVNYTKNSIISRTADLQIQIAQLNAKRISLSETNKKIFLYGENSDDFIFALNRLPNNFQRLTKDANSKNKIEDLKAIDRLSLSSSISNSITEILSEQYPEAMDRLIEGGVKSVDVKDLLNIQLWLEDSIEKLNQLGYTVINRGDIVDDITNQINVLNDVLNSLQLIKLNKNGKISRQQPKELKEIFGTEGKVSNRTNVSKNAKPVRRETARVLGSATDEELKNLVKQTREKDELEGLGEPTNVEESKAIENINNATLDTIEEVYQRGYLEAVEKGENTTDIVAAKNKRLQELNTVISIKNLNKGEYLISKNPIFTDVSGEIVIVTKVKNGKVTLKNIKTDISKEFTEAELIENFEKTTMEATQPEPEVTLTPVDVEDSKQSKDILKELQNEGETLAKAQQQAKDSDMKSRWDKLGDNSKTC